MALLTCLCDKFIILHISLPKQHTLNKVLTEHWHEGPEFSPCCLVPECVAADHTAATPSAALTVHWLKSARARRRVTAQEVGWQQDAR